MAEFKNMLYPVALTDISPKVAPYVVALARKLDAQVHLLHVLRRFDWFMDTYVPDSPEPDFKRIASDFEDKLLVQAEQKLKAFKKKYLKDVKIVKASVVSGTHYRQILDYAKSEGIDFIIMGSGKRRQKMMFGSVADKVSRLAKIPVMLIKSS
ncbi:MAG: universal stress protein [Deltaproteobacteria bacterium]|jgi:nucleotide-binding universal stress UspA family protein|nr:universal stress protein [Deltaproteobacteria bacterium]